MISIVIFADFSELSSDLLEIHNTHREEAIEGGL